MRVSVIGASYVGLVTGACLADAGHNVLCLDLDAQNLERLRQGIVPIHEPGLSEIVKANLSAKRLRFTGSIAEAAQFAVVQIIAVGTPQNEDGSADLRDVLRAAEGIARHMPDYRLIIDKSTVPIGTADAVEQTVRATLTRRGAEFDFAVVSNPEFLKEGQAVADFTQPDRIVLGIDNRRDEPLLRELYAPFQHAHDRTVIMSRRSAEMSKYAANAMLAARISLMNELALLADHVGADIDDVRRGIGADPRIGYAFLYAGIGYGGSCFPNDVRALIRTGADHQHDMRILRAVEVVNEDQKVVLVRKAKQRFGSLAGMRVALWGLAFKPNTDDLREAPARAIMHALWQEGARISAYDPIASAQCHRLYGERTDLTLADTAIEAATGADFLIVATEWKEFSAIDFDELRQRLKRPVIFDGRNLYNRGELQSHGFEHHCIGRGVQSERRAPAAHLRAAQARESRPLPSAVLHAEPQRADATL